MVGEGFGDAGGLGGGHGGGEVFDRDEAGAEQSAAVLWRNDGLPTRDPAVEDEVQPLQVTDAYLDTGGTLTLMLDQLENSILIEGFPEYADKEAEAVAIRLFQIGVISGLLQTPEYATAYEQAFVRRGTVTQQHADERVKFLLARQAKLERPDPPHIHAVLDEWSLRRPIGGRAVMIGQLAHLELLAERPNMTIQVAPIGLGENRPFAHPVTLLTMPNRSLLGYSETHQRGFLERNQETLAGWAKDYDRLQVEALPLAASLELIRAVRKDFESEP